MVTISCMMNLLAQAFHLLLQPVNFCYTILQLGLYIKSTQRLIALLKLALLVLSVEKTRQEKATPFGINLMRSQAVSRAAQECCQYLINLLYASYTINMT